MNPNELVESKWMTAEEFGLKNVPREPRVTIKDVRTQRVGSKENWGVLHFVEEWAKPLKVNTTSKRALMLMFSETETNAWIGKRIDLFAKPGNYPKGKKVAVRIKGSPDISQPISFAVQAFGGGEDVYNLVPSGHGASQGNAPATPKKRMWTAWKESGHTDANAFWALIKKATGKATEAGLDETDVAKFDAALRAADDPPPPPAPISDEEAAEILAKERALANGQAQ